VDFTREPIIETIITPKDGHKLVVRSSKGASQEEYFVDAVEVVSFGQGLFFRSLERPKSFLVPIADYEVVEVREARMILKNISSDRSIKIGGGRENSRENSKENAVRAPREVEKVEAPAQEEEAALVSESEEADGETRPEMRLDKKRDRRRHYRKRRNGKDEIKEEGAQEPILPQLEEDGKVDIQPPAEISEESGAIAASLSSNLLSSLLQPPPTLISETINRYRENALFKSAFFLTEEEQYKPHDKVHELLNEEGEFHLEQEPALNAQLSEETSVFNEESTQFVEPVEPLESIFEEEPIQHVPDEEAVQEGLFQEEQPLQQEEVDANHSVEATSNAVKEPEEEHEMKKEFVEESLEMTHELGSGENGLPLFAEEGLNGTQNEEPPFERAALEKDDEEKHPQ
jgi:hypothetical protein